MTRNNNIAIKNRSPQRRGIFWLLIICLFFSELLLYTWIRTQSTQTLISISREQNALTTAQSYKKALQIERDRLKSNDRITRIAKTKLNLSQDTSGQTIYMNRDDG